ncbi:MAG: AI-2E family transporter [Pseudomonadota bacterium]
MTTLSNSTKQRIGWGLLAAGLLVFSWSHASVLAPFALSLVLAYGLKPVVESLVRRHMPRPLAVSLCLLLAVLMMVVLFVLLVPIVSQLVPMLRTQVPELISRAWAVALPWLHQWGLELPASLDEVKGALARWTNGHASQWAGAFLSSVLIGGSGLLTLLGFLLMVPMLAFYWLVDWAHISQETWALLPPRWRPQVQSVLHECDEIMGQYLRGQVLVMLILAAYYSICLGLAGFSLALPIGVFTGLAVCIPYLGYGVGLLLALLAGLLQFSQADAGLLYPLVVVGVIYGLGQVVESFFLTPRLVGSRIGLHPLAVILALLLFGQWLGFVGILIALPSSALGVVLGRRALHGYKQSTAYLGSPGSDQE